jgi:hypothetical protein
VYIEHLIYSVALAVIVGMIFSRFKGTDPSWIIIAADLDISEIFRGNDGTISSLR